MGTTLRNCAQRPASRTALIYAAAILFHERYWIGDCACADAKWTASSLASFHTVAWLHDAACCAVGAHWQGKGYKTSAGPTPTMAMATKRMHIHHGSQLRQPLASTRPVLYTHTLCPYAQRVWLTMLYKDLEFDLVQVDLSNKPPWYWTVNAKGLVPAVVVDGRSHTESLDICRWLETSYPDPPLTPATAAARSSMEEILSATSSIVSAGLSAVAGTDSHTWGIGRRPSARQQQQLDRELSLLADALQQHGGPYLCGPGPSLADMALQPFLERFQLALQQFQGYHLNDVHQGAISEWLGTMSQLPCCQVASADRALLQQAFAQHCSLDFFDYVPYDAWRLHPHLQHPITEHPLAD